MLRTELFWDPGGGARRWACTVDLYQGNFERNTERQFKRNK
jgi:hypothetical protein